MLPGHHQDDDNDDQDDGGDDQDEGEVRLMLMMSMIVMLIIMIRNLEASEYVNFFQEWKFFRVVHSVTHLCRKTRCCNEKENTTAKALLDICSYNVIEHIWKTPVVQMDKTLGRNRR